MSAFETPLAQQLERVLLQELESGRATIRSAGVLYGVLMAASATGENGKEPFRPSNMAIMKHLGDPNPAGKLDRVKKVAHELIDRWAAQPQPESEA